MSIRLILLGLVLLGVSAGVSPRLSIDTDPPEPDTEYYFSDFVKDKPSNEVTASDLANPDPRYIDITQLGYNGRGRLLEALWTSANVNRDTAHYSRHHLIKDNNRNRRDAERMSADDWSAFAIKGDFGDGFIHTLFGRILEVNLKKPVFDTFGYDFNNGAGLAKRVFDSTLQAMLDNVMGPGCGNNCRIS